MAKATPKTKKASRPKAIKRLKVTHVSLMPDGKFELGLAETRARPKAKPAAKAPPTAKPKP